MSPDPRGRAGGPTICSEEAEVLLDAWAATAAIDHHCHPLLRWPSSAPLDAMALRRVFTEAHDPRIAARHVPHTVAYRIALRRLGTELGCPPTEEAILEVRAGRYPADHARRLLAHSGTGALLLDHGFATDATFTPAEHRAQVPVPQREIVRLESLAEDRVAGCRDAGEWLGSVRAGLRDAVEGGAVGVKTIAAYRAGLRLRRPDQLDVAEAFEMLRAAAVDGTPESLGSAGAPASSGTAGTPGSSGPPQSPGAARALESVGAPRGRRAERARLAGEALCHALVFEGAAECTALGVPLQVHCGFGDPDEDLGRCSPLGLRPLLDDPGYEGLKLVLLHCYPYHREAAWLCSVFPDVHMDLSLTLPLAALDGAKAMAETLGLCPWSKLLYASDASRLPEVYFVAAALHREALAEAFGECLRHGILDGAEAVEAGRRVLAGNAARLYGISVPA